MSQQPPNNGQHVRRVVLPSGRAIEVVYFESPASNGPVPATKPLRDLHICPDCDRDLVYPVEWEETSPALWEVQLRCPNCGRCEIGTFDQPTVDHFDKMLDLGTEVLVGDLKRLEHANMEQEIEVFACALRADALLPEDF